MKWLCVFSGPQMKGSPQTRATSNASPSPKPTDHIPPSDVQAKVVNDDDEEEGGDDNNGDGDGGGWDDDDGDWGDIDVSLIVEYSLSNQHLYYNIHFLISVLE